MNVEKLGKQFPKMSDKQESLFSALLQRATNRVDRPLYEADAPQTPPAAGVRSVKAQTTF